MTDPNLYHDQHEYDIRFEWGLDGTLTLSPISDVLVIVDVLSFTTCVEIATAGGAIVYPYSGEYDKAAEFAESNNAELALKIRSEDGYSLSPKSLLSVPEGLHLVLPSPNGARLSLAGTPHVRIAGALRNAAAVAKAANHSGRQIGVIAAGERWLIERGRMRPSLEDLIGAGAIIHGLIGEKSPEAEAAEAVYLNARKTLQNTIAECSSGRELIMKGHPEDIKIAAELNVSQNVPRLENGAYRSWTLQD